MAEVNKEILVRALASSYPDDQDGWARWLRRMSNEELRRLVARRGVDVADAAHGGAR